MFIGNQNYVNKKLEISNKQYINKSSRKDDID